LDFLSWVDVLLARAVNPEKGYTDIMSLDFQQEKNLVCGTAKLPVQSGLSTRAIKNF
jgi:hypothetical protein